jgi:hypothetical protein
LHHMIAATCLFDRKKKLRARVKRLRLPQCNTE